MADGLHHLLDAKRQLLLAISHELRSPLTRAGLDAELVDEGAARDALLQDLAEMRDLITDLLQSERLAGGHTALHTEPVDLNALVREVTSTALASARLAVSGWGCTCAGSSRKRMAGRWRRATPIPGC